MISNPLPRRGTSPGRRRSEAARGVRSRQTARHRSGGRSDAPGDLAQGGLSLALKNEAQDLQGEAFALLVRWTHERRDFSEEASLETLASRLVDQVARALRWSRIKELAIAEGVASEPRTLPDSAVDRIAGAEAQERLLALLDRLPGDQGHVIHAAARASAGGPPLERVLRVGAEKARLRLFRARLALVALARAEGFILSSPMVPEASDE